MAPSNSLSVCNIQTVHYSAQQSRAESEKGAAENQDAAPLPWTRERGRLRALGPSVRHPGEARLAHSGALCRYNKFHEAELIWHRMLVLGGTNTATCSGQGRGRCRCSCQLQTTVLMAPVGRKGVYGRREGKRERSKTRSPNFNDLPFVNETVRCPDLGNAEFR